MNCEKAEAGSGEQFAAWGLHALAGEVKLQLLAGQLHSRRFKKSERVTRSFRDFLDAPSLTRVGGACRRPPAGPARETERDLESNGCHREQCVSASPNGP